MRDSDSFWIYRQYISAKEPNSPSCNRSIAFFLVISILFYSIALPMTLWDIPTSFCILLFIILGTPCVLDAWISIINDEFFLPFYWIHTWLLGACCLVSHFPPKVFSIDLEVHSDTCAHCTYTDIQIEKIHWTRNWFCFLSNTREPFFNDQHIRDEHLICSIPEYFWGSVQQKWIFFRASCSLSLHSSPLPFDTFL